MKKNPPGADNEIFLEEDIPVQYPDPGAENQHIIGMHDINNGDFQADEVEIENPISQVASPPAKNILIIAILVLVSIVFLYKFVFKESDKVVAEKQLKEEIAAQPVTNAKPATQQEGTPQVNIGVVDTPELPVTDNIQSLPPIPATPEIPAATDLEPAKKLELPAPQPQAIPEPVKVEQQAKEPVNIEPKKEPVEEVINATPTGPSQEELDAQQHAREVSKRKTGMLIINGGGTPKDILDGKNDPTAAAKSSATNVTATKVDDLSLMVLQGKMIDAVLETTINTDLPGNLRAIISRDIYAESGKNILIPVGSRLIGSYNNGIQIGQQRLLISWGRVIRPDGVDIDISSPGTDQLGRSGMTGIIDNKYSETLGNSLLVSAISISSSLLIDKVQKAQTSSTSTTTNTDGSTTSTQTGNPTDLSVLQGVQNFTDQAGVIAKQLANTSPTIIINQGARIKVFVNKDLIFPASVVNKTNSIN